MMVAATIYLIPISISVLTLALCLYRQELLKSLNTCSIDDMLWQDVVNSNSSKSCVVEIETIPSHFFKLP